MASSTERLRFKDRILENLGKAIKSIQEQQLCNQDDELVTLTNEDESCGRLCEHLDHVFLHGLRHLHHGYWKTVSEFTRKDAVKEIRTLQNVTTDLGRSRAWLFLALNECCLESYIRCYGDNKKIVQKYYSRDALLLDQQNVNILLTLTAGLEHVIFQLELDVPYLDIGAAPPRSRSRCNTETEEDRLSLCSMDSIASTSHLNRKVLCSTPCESLHSDNSETMSINSYDTSQSSGNHGNHETKIERLDNVMQEEAQEEGEDDDLLVIRVKGQGQSKGKQSKRKLRKSGRERKSPVTVDHIQEENEDEKVDIEELKKEILPTDASVNKLENEIKLKDILKDISVTPKTHKEEGGKKKHAHPHVHNKEEKKERTPENLGEAKKEDEVELQHKSEVFDLYSTTDDVENKPVPSQNIEHLQHSKPSHEDLKYSHSVKDMENSTDLQGVRITHSSLPNGDVQLTVTVNKSHDSSYSSLSSEPMTAEDTNQSEKSKAICDKTSMVDQSKKGSDLVNQNIPKGDDVYSSNQKSSASTLQSMADDIINQSGAVLHQHMFEEEPEETKIEERDNSDQNNSDQSPGEIELGNNTKLHLMLDVFHNSDEQFVKMYATRVGHTDGDPQTVFVLITDMCLYLLSQSQTDHKFIKDSSVPFKTIDYISISIDSQVLHIVCTKRRNQYWLTTGSADITQSIADSIVLGAKDTHKISVLSDATSQKIALRKYIAKECRCDPSEAEIKCLSLVFWDDPAKGSNSDTAFREGHLLYKVRSPSLSGIGGHLLHSIQDPMSLLYGQPWKSAYVVLKDGLLCLYNSKSDSKPFVFVQMGGEECVGCRRVKDTDRNHSIGIMKADTSTIEIALATELEANDWLQSLCQAVAEGLQSKAETKSGYQPCCCILTPSKILMCHEDMQTNFFRTLGSAHVIEVSAVYVDPQEQTYCILEFESTDSSVSTEQWVLYFSTKLEREKYEKALSSVWSVHFEVEVPVMPLEDFSLERKCRETAKKLRSSLQVH